MDKPWYHKTSIYQIYPRSFHDTNGDGIGDLKGIIQKLDYLHELGFETLWISPFFSSPQADTGYDISSYTDIAPEYGSIEDALQLIEGVHQRGMKIVFDMVMNHTSDEHPWFRESRSSQDNPKANWYIWQDKPNNWQSMTGGSGWHYAPERNQYFWSSFDWLNLTINRDEVRTPMQWDGTGNAWFSSSEQTWLPVHKNHLEINVEKANQDESSLLNIIRKLMKIRKNETVLQEGSLEVLKNLPHGILGYRRTWDHTSLTILLNFDGSEKVVRTEFSECIFAMSASADLKEKAIHMNGFGGVILRA